MSETGLHTRPRGWELLLAVIRWFLIIFFAVYTLFPLIWLVVSSLKTNFEFLKTDWACFYQKQLK